MQSRLVRRPTEICARAAQKDTDARWTLKFAKAALLPVVVPAEARVSGFVPTAGWYRREGRATHRMEFFTKANTLGVICATGCAGSTAPTGQVRNAHPVGLWAIHLPLG